MGLPPVRYQKPEEGDSLLIRRAETRLMGLTLRWKETPFEWIQNRYFTEERRFLNGPMKQIKMLLALEPSNGGCRLNLTAEVVPRNFIYSALLQTVMLKKMVNDFKKVVDHVNRFEEEKVETPLPQPHKVVVNQALLNRRMALALTGHDEYAPIAKKLAHHIQTALDNEVLVMRPFECADNWGMDRKQVLEFFLFAAKAGMVDLRWALLCPTCKVSVASQKGLGDLKPEFHCDVCRISYDSEFDRSVEARFQVSPAIRETKTEVYCIGGPGNHDQTYAQFLLRSGEEREVEVELASYRWKIFAYGEGESYLDVTKDGRDSSISVDIEKDKVSSSSGSVKEGKVKIRFKNHSGELALMHLEEDKWIGQAVTAAYVTSLPKFRDLFSSEVLAPGEEISVRNLTVMFTDLKGSTAFYQKTGDAKAYHLVRSHFEFLNEILKKHNGSLVKTIGDAVFAIFFKTVEGVKAAVEIQKKIKEFNAKNQSQFEIKLGVHSGPLIAVNANGKIDYFGSTTNIGSRLEKESHGNDVVITQTVAEDPDTRQYLSEKSFKQEQLLTQLRGIEEKLHLLRLIP